MKIFTLALTLSLLFIALPALAQNIAPPLSSGFLLAFGCNELVQSDGANGVGVTSCDYPAATTFDGAGDFNWSGDVDSYYLSLCGYRSSDGTYYPFGDPILPLSGSSDCSWIVGGDNYIYHNGTFFDGSRGVKTSWSLIMKTFRDDAFALGYTSAGPILAEFSAADNHRMLVKNVVGGTAMTRDKGGNIYFANGSQITKYAPNASKVVYTKTIPNAYISSISVDDYGEVYATGSTNGGIPIVFAPQPQPGGGSDAFLTVLSPKADRFVYSSYIGGNGDDYAVGVRGGSGASVMGIEWSWDWDGRQNECPGEYANCSQEVFQSSFGAFRNSSLPTKLVFGSRKVGTTTTKKVLLKNLGDTPLNVTGVQISGAEYAQINTCAAPVNPDKTCGLVVSFTPFSSGEHDGKLIVTSDSLLSPQQVTLTGAGK